MARYYQRRVEEALASLAPEDVSTNRVVCILKDSRLSKKVEKKGWGRARYRLRRRPR